MSDDILFFSNSEAGQENRQKKAVLALNNPGAEKWLREQYSSDFQVIASVTRPEEAVDKIREHEADLLIAARESKSGGIPNIESLLANAKKSNPKIDVVLIVGDTDTEGERIIKYAHENHIHDLIYNKNGGSITISHMKEAMQKVIDRWAKKPASIVIVVSWKGGAGATTVAANLAVEAAKSRNVLVIDASERPGLDLMMGIDTPRQKSKAHGSDFISAVGDSDSNILELVSLNLRDYAMIILDAGARAAKLKYTLNEASKIIVVADQSPDCIRSTQAALKDGIPKEKVKMIINKFDEYGGPPLEAFENSFGVEIIASIEDNRAQYLRAASEGVPVAAGGAIKVWDQVNEKVK